MTPPVVPDHGAGCCADAYVSSPSVRLSIPPFLPGSHYCRRYRGACRVLKASSHADARSLSAKCAASARRAFACVVARSASLPGADAVLTLVLRYAVATMMVSPRRRYICTNHRYLAALLTRCISSAQAGPTRPREDLQKCVSSLVPALALVPVLVTCGMISCSAVYTSIAGRRRVCPRRTGRGRGLSPGSQMHVHVHGQVRHRTPPPFLSFSPSQRQDPACTSDS